MKHWSLLLKCKSQLNSAVVLDSLSESPRRDVPTTLRRRDAIMNERSESYIYAVEFNFRFLTCTSITSCFCVFVFYLVYMQKLIILAITTHQTGNKSEPVLLLTYPRGYWSPTTRSWFLMCEKRRSLELAINYGGWGEIGGGTSRMPFETIN